MNTIEKHDHKPEEPCSVECYLNPNYKIPLLDLNLEAFEFAVKVAECKEHDYKHSFAVGLLMIGYIAGYKKAEERCLKK